MVKTGDVLFKALSPKWFPLKTARLVRGKRDHWSSHQASGTHGLALDPANFLIYTAQGSCFPQRFGTGAKYKGLHLSFQKHPVTWCRVEVA